MTHTETPDSVNDWAKATFGAASSNARVAARANEEMAELQLALATCSSRQRIIDEAADVAIVLCRLSCRVGGDILADSAGIAPLRLAHSPLEAWFAALANAEIAKLLKEATNGNDPLAIREHCAGAYFRLGLLVDAFDAHLWAAVEAKMAVNRKRKWRVDESGCGYHHQGSGRR